MDDKLLYILLAGGVALLLLALLGYLAMSRRRRRSRPINNLPERRSVDQRLTSLSIDVDSSRLTMPERQGRGEPRYLVLDTETYDALTSNEDLETINYSPPVALSWQLLDAEGLLLDERSFIIRQMDEAEPMTASAIEIHGISVDMMQRGEEPRQVYRALEEVLGRVELVVAHHWAFHRETLVRDLRRHGYGALAEQLSAKPSCCTMLWGQELGFKRAEGRALYPRLDELFGYLHFQRMHVPLSYRSKTLRDVRLVSACLRCKL